LFIVRATIGRRSSHATWSPSMKWCKTSYRTWIVRSVCLSVWGWKAVEDLDWDFKHLQKSFQNFEMNLVSRSDMRTLGIPWCW
jgi:hypothetical protein